MAAAVGCDSRSEHARSDDESEDSHPPYSESGSIYPSASEAFRARSNAAEVDTVTAKVIEEFNQNDYLLEVEITNALSDPIYYWPEQWQIFVQNGNEWDRVTPTGIHRDLLYDTLEITPGASRRIRYGIRPYVPNMKAGLYRIEDVYFVKDPKVALEAGKLPEANPIKIPIFEYKREY